MSRALPQTRRILPASSGTKDSLRIAAIDVGSNSIHMIVAQADTDGAITTLWRMKEPVGLGRMSFPNRRLSQDAMDRAINVLARFHQAALQRQCEKVVAVATSAIREASNGGDFIERAKREIGVYVRVVTAREEARLIYLAVRHAIDLRREPHLIVDIGGGSVELIVGDERGATLLDSRKLGAARMTATFVKSDPISESDKLMLLNHYDDELTPVCEIISDLSPVKAIGTSGTLENIAAMCGGHAETNGDGLAGVIERSRFEKMLAELVGSRSKDRTKIRGLDDGRRDQIIAGALLVNELFARLKLKRIHICPSALREGILLDYLNRHLPDLAIRREVPDPRRRSVIDLARRCDWHKTHSEQAARLALRLFDQLKPLHKLGAIERELLEYGTMLHDIGWHIAREKHQKHSMYLILHGNLQNFTQEEIRIIANLARYHRKAPPSKNHAQFASLSSSARRLVTFGAAILRVADALDRSHSSVISDIDCKIDDRQVKCVLSTRSDAQLEIWAARRKRGLFGTVFGREISFTLGKK